MILILLYNLSAHITIIWILHDYWNSYISLRHLCPILSVSTTASITQVKTS